MRVFVLVCALALTGCTATQRAAVKRVAKPTIQCIREETPGYLARLKVCVERKLQNDKQNIAAGDHPSVGKGNR